MASYCYCQFPHIADTMYTGNVIHITYLYTNPYPELPRETHPFLKMAHALHEAARVAVCHLAFKAQSAGQR